MSKYTKCNTGIRIEDVDLLKEVLKDLWPKMFGAQWQLEDSDIEVFDKPTPALGYQGDVRSPGNVDPDYVSEGNIIIRGQGIVRADANSKKLTKASPGARQRVPGASNDLVLKFTEEGDVELHISEYDIRQLHMTKEDLAAKLTAGIIRKKLEEFANDSFGNIEIDGEIMSPDAASKVIADKKEDDVTIVTFKKAKPKQSGQNIEKEEEKVAKPKKKQGPLSGPEKLTN